MMSNNERKCGKCVECCVTIGDAQRDAYERCCKLRCNDRGCSIYRARPEDCRLFLCTYLMGWPDERPDRCGVLVHVTSNQLADGPCINLAECRAGAIDANVELVERYRNDPRFTVMMVDYRDGRVHLSSRDRPYLQRVVQKNKLPIEIPPGDDTILFEMER